MALPRLLARWAPARDRRDQPSAPSRAPVVDQSTHRHSLIWVALVVVLAICLVLLFHRVARLDRRFIAVSPPGLWGLTLYAIGDNRAAADAYRSHWKHPMAGITYEDPAHLAVIQGDLDTAERLVKARLASSPASISALIMMAEIALGRRAPQQALELLERVKDPDAIDAFFLRSVAHAQAKNYDQAIVWANRSLRQWERNEGLSTFHRLIETIGTLEQLPDEQRPLALLALYYRYLAMLDPGREASVLRYADLAIQRGDHVADARVAIGAVRHRRRQREAALAAFLHAIEANPRHAEARRWAALSYAERGDVANEYRMARAAHDAAPEDSHYLFRLMTILIHKLGDYRAALDVIHTTYVARPLDFQAHMWLGHIHRSLRDHTRSLDHYRAAVELRPDSATAREGVGLALSTLGRLDEAAEAYRRAVAIAPSWPRVRAQLADVYRRQRKYAEAIRELERDFQLGGATADQQMGLCFLYLRSGAAERAVGCYEAIVAAHPDHVGARRTLGFIRPGVKAGAAP